MASTGNVFVDTLAGVSWLDVGRDRNITYYFDDALGHRPWRVIEAPMWEVALHQWANVANITTQRVGLLADADLQEMWRTNAEMQTNHGTPFVGFHTLPSASGPAFGEYNTQYTFVYFVPPGITPGGIGFWLFLQQTGHALGLVNPHGSALLPGPRPVFPGITGPNDVGTLSYNQELYSVMSSNHGPKTSSGSNNSGHAATPMAFDIAAIQSLYGPNTSYRTGSDTYVLPDTNADGTSWQCIWDAGGTDTIRYNGSLSATIDLRAATLVNGDPNAGGFVSQVVNVFGGYTIANGVVIENAIGGKGNDTLIGNSADNSLDGGAGDDSVMFSGARAAYTVTDLGGSVRVTGPEGSDTISNVEKLVFTDTTVNLAPSAAPSPAGPVSFSPGWLSAGAGDFSGDGRSDVLLQHANGFVALWQMNGNQIVSNLGVANPGPQYHAAGVADFDADGRSDILMQHENGFVALWQMNGNQITANLAVADPGPNYHVVGTGDFNGDGFGDALLRHDNGFIAMWQMHGYQIVSNLAVASPGPQWHVAGTGDFDGDNRTDILLRHDTGQIVLWQMNGNQIVSNLEVANPGTSYHVAGVGDFGGDGHSDVLLRHDNGFVALWQMNGNQIVSNTAVANPGPLWHTTAPGDYDGDGSSDTLVAHDNGFVALWEMTGAHIDSNLGVGTIGSEWKIVPPSYELV